MKIRVAFLEEGTEIGGAEINVLNLLAHLDSKQFDPFVICPAEGSFAARVRAAGGKVEIVPRVQMLSTSIMALGRKITNPIAVCWNLLSFFPSALRLARFIKNNKVQVLHTNSMLAHFYGAMACRLSGARCVWHIQDIVDPEQAFGLFRKGLSFAGNWLPHRIVCISRAVADMFKGKSRNCVEVVYNGCDVENFRPYEGGNGVRAEFGLGKDDIIIGIVGRIVHWKGHKIFMEAARKIADLEPCTRFMIVGDAAFGKQAYVEEVRALAEKLGIFKRVVFTGRRDDIAEVLSALDILVNASTLPEPFGLTIIEAMACGKPVVAAEGGGVPEIIIDRKTGILFPMGDSAALARALLELIENPAMRKSYGDAGRERAVNCFSHRAFAHNMGEQYIKAIRASW
jgi:glycosyltransferase involved in cell wall biosynthesis